MSSGKKGKSNISTKDTEPRIKDEVRHSIYGILAISISVVLFLASLNLGGAVGGYTYGVLHYLFGAGFYLLPVALIILAVSFFRSSRPRIVPIRMGGLLLFLLSGLGLIELVLQTNTAGVVGHAVASLGLKAFGAASWVIFIGGLGISGILFFETSITLAPVLEWSRKRALAREQSRLAKHNEEPDLGDNDLDDDQVDVITSEPEMSAGSEATTPKATNTLSSLLGRKKLIEDELREEFVPMVRADLSPYTPPPSSLLSRDSGKPAAGDIKANSNIIKRTLSNFGIEVEMDEISIGPSITRYALKPAEGVKLSRIVALQNDLALSLAAHPLRVEAPIPGKSLVGIEVPNSIKTTVRLGTMIDDPAFRASDKALLVPLGRNISGGVQFADMAKMPHLLIAGTTGSGKSVSIHALIISLLYRNSPDNLRLLMIDPKRVELTMYKNIPHLLTSVITNPKKAILSLKWAAKEMDRRYDILEAEQARDIKSYHENIYNPALEGYNKKVAGGALEDEQRARLISELPESMPYIMIIIDELADIMSTYPRELESAIVRLAQMSRAVGIHLVLSTQRPSTEVITGLIKANVPSRVALQVPSQIDSRTIIDMPGAERLLGAGDLLYLSGETSKPTRLQSAFVSEEEVKKVVAFIVGNNEGLAEEIIDMGPSSEASDRSSSSSDFGDEASGDDDTLYEEAKDIVIQSGKASSSLLQRKLKVGYARAARLLDMLEERGVVGVGQGAKPREVYSGSSATDEYANEFDKQESANQDEQ